jgi:hypothetical protein
MHRGTASRDALTWLVVTVGSVRRMGPLQRDAPGELAGRRQSLIMAAHTATLMSNRPSIPPRDSAGGPVCNTTGGLSCLTSGLGKCVQGDSACAYLKKQSK